MYHHGRLHAYGRPGEIFIRTVAAFNTAPQVWLQHIPITEAADNTLMEIAAIGRAGGLILLDAKGNYATRFNTRGSSRALSTATAFQKSAFSHELNSCCSHISQTAHNHCPAVLYFVFVFS